MIFLYSSSKTAARSGGRDMAYFAKIEHDIVVHVISVSNEVCGEPTLDFPDTCAAGRAFIANTLRLDGFWKQTSFNNNFRGTFAGIGYTYDADIDEFISPLSAEE